MCNLFLVTLLKMQFHYSQYSCENTTPIRGTFPLAYKEVLLSSPPPPPGGYKATWLFITPCLYNDNNLSPTSNCEEFFNPLTHFMVNS